MMREIIHATGLWILFWTLPSIAGEATATIFLHVPERAQVYFNGTLTQQAGNFRTYFTPQIEAGLSYSYAVRVVLPTGREESRTVSVTAGEVKREAFFPNITVVDIYGKDPFDSIPVGAKLKLKGGIDIDPNEDHVWGASVHTGWFFKGGIFEDRPEELVWHCYFKVVPNGTARVTEPATITVTHAQNLKKGEWPHDVFERRYAVLNTDSALFPEIICEAPYYCPSSLNRYGAGFDPTIDTLTKSFAEIFDMEFPAPTVVNP